MAAQTSPEAGGAAGPGEDGVGFDSVDIMDAIGKAVRTVLLDPIDAIGVVVTGVASGRGAAYKCCDKCECGCCAVPDCDCDDCDCDCDVAKVRGTAAKEEDEGGDAVGFFDRLGQGLTDAAGSWTAAAPAEGADGAAAPGAGERAGERRVDISDQKPYTRAQFVANYGGTEEWEVATPFADPPSKAATKVAEEEASLFDRIGSGLTDVATSWEGMVGDVLEANSSSGEEQEAVAAATGGCNQEVADAGDEGGGRSAVAPPTGPPPAKEDDGKEQQ